ncbi:MAG: histidine phosphatase family protein [Clostridia bacterium]|jgi:broad specificity phosphatase PhoE|nr:histidine phosphatase family protein [Clostridia bacterium]
MHMQTAQIINRESNIPMVFDERLSEKDFGEFEGMPNTEFDYEAF